MKLQFFALLMAFSIHTRSQQIAEMNYAQLEPFLHKSTDTTYVVNFWATWCKPCVDELPVFLSVASEMRHKKVKFIFVSLDFAKQKESRLMPFIDQYKIQDMVILLNDPNSNEWINKVDSSWSGGIPATLIYKSTNRGFFEHTLEYDELLNEIKLKN